MNKLLFLLYILLDESRKRLFIPKALVFSLLFILLALTALNYKSYLSFLTSDYAFGIKIKILWLISIGSFSAVEFRDVVFLFIAAILFGVNMELVSRKIKLMAKMGSLRLTIGAGIVSLAATGCASCGLSLASLVGLTGVVALLPFGGLELYLFSIVLLIGMLFYNLHALIKACDIPYPEVAGKMR